QRSALHRHRPAGGGRQLAATPVVETLRDLHLARWRADRLWRVAGLARPRLQRLATAETEGALRMSRSSRFLPLLILVGMLAALAWRLANPGDTVIRSRLEGLPVPAFTLPAALPGKPPLSSKDLAAGEPHLLNIFASWCVPCIAEAPVLAELRRRRVRIDAIAIRDRPEEVAEFLAR